MVRCQYFMFKVESHYILQMTLIVSFFKPPTSHSNFNHMNNKLPLSLTTDGAPDVDLQHTSSDASFDFIALSYLLTDRR